MENPEELQEQFLQVIENQLDAEDPPEVKSTLERLKGEGYNEETAKKLMAQCVGVEIYEMLNNQETFNQERYVKNLHNLPQTP